MRPNVPACALEFQDLFKVDDDDTLAPDDGPSDPIGSIIAKFMDDDALAKLGVGGVSDCAWNASMVTTVEEVYEKAGESALSAMKKFLRSSNALALSSKAVDCSALRKSFREEKCLRQ